MSAMPTDATRTPCSARDAIAFVVCGLITAGAFVGLLLGATP